MLFAFAAPATALDLNLGMQVLAEINLARTEPHTYADFLRVLRSQFRGKFYVLPGSSTHIQTSEGVKAVDEAIKDDGVPDRGHRINTFSTAFNTAGVACNPHPRFGSMCVVDFAGGFRAAAGSVFQEGKMNR
ncbi:MAG: hypothetical protein PVSMB11_09560 [Desulfuromonadaceae bacterium]